MRNTGKTFFDNFLKPALEKHGYDAYKAIDAPNNITKHIIRELAMADLVLAVLSEHLPLPPLTLLNFAL